MRSLTYGTRPSHSSLYRLIKVCAAKFATLAESCICALRPCIMPAASVKIPLNMLHLVIGPLVLAADVQMTEPLLLSDIAYSSDTHAAVTTCSFNCMLPMTAYLQARKLRRGRTQSIQSSCVVTFAHAHCSRVVRLCCAIVTGNDICSVISSMGATDSVYDVCVLYIVCYVAGHMQQKLFIAMCRLLIKTCLQ